MRSWKKWRARLPHAFPFFLAAATVAHLVAENPYEGIEPYNLRDPLALASLTVLFIWAVASLFVRDRLRRSMLALVGAVPPLASGYVFGGLRDMAMDAALRGAIEVGLLGALMAVGVLATLRVGWPAETARFLNVFTALLLVFATPGMYRMFVHDPDAASGVDTIQVRGSRPDIYLVVLDAYSGNESLAAVYGFDNSPMIDSLRFRGFAFPNRPRSNYTTTFLSVGSMLNRQYLNRVAEETAPDYRDRSGLYHRLEFNRTVDDLKRLGYEFVFIGSSYPPMASNRLADVQYSVVRSREFERLWLQMTALPAALAMVCPFTGRCRSSALHFGPESAAETEDRLAFLESVAERPGPKFVYAHWLLPHGPFRFDDDCGHIPPGWTEGEMRIRDDSVVRRRFVDQVRCTNRKILRFVDAVRSTSGDSAVVILQADHGNGRFAGGRPTDLSSASPDQVWERFDVFAAYAGPDGVGDSLAANRTPVNLFRTLFRVLWGFDEPPLDDRFYWSGREEPLRLIPVSVDSLTRGRSPDTVSSVGRSLR